MILNFSKTGYCRLPFLFRNLSVLKLYMYKESENTETVNIELAEKDNRFDNKLIQLFKKSGKNYFDQLVLFLCEETGTKYAFIGKYNENNHTVSTHSFYANNTYVEEFEYDLENTPCNTVIDSELCIYPKSVQQSFPKDEELKTFGIEGYIGLPLFDLSENAVGIVVVMDDKPFKEVEQLKNLLSLVESKTEFELERIALKNELILSNKSFQEVFENFQDVFFLIDYNKNNEQVELVISPSVEKTLGYTIEEIRSLNFGDFYAEPGERKAFLQLIKIEKKVKNYPLAFKKKDGSLLHVEVDCELIDGDESKKIAFSLRGVLKDVTEKYIENLRIEMAYLIAEKSQRRLTNIRLLAEFIQGTLSKVMNVSNFYIALHDSKKNELYMPVFTDENSKEFGAEYRVPFSNGLTEYIIKSRNVIVKDKKGLQEIIKKERLIVRGELSECYVGVPLKGEGKCFGVMVMQSYIKGYHFTKEDIELLKFISIQVAYVIERTQWQEALIKKENHYRSLVENSSEIIGIINEEGTILYVSESSEKIIGYRPIELMGKNITDFIKLENSTELIKNRAAKSHSSRTDILKIYDKKGHKKYLEISLNKDRNKSNELIFNAKDVTESVISTKKNEFAQKRLNTLHQIEKALLSTKPFSEMLNDALKIITKNVLDVDRVSVGLLDYDNERAEVLVLKTKYKTINGIKVGDFISFKELTCLETILNQKPFYIGDISKLKHVNESDKKNGEDGIKSYYIRPIVINKKVIGTFNFGSKTINYFKKVDEDLLEEVTQLVAVVIHDAILKKELANRESDLTDIFNYTTEGIVKTSKEGKFMFVNKRLCEMLGYTEKELLKKDFKDITYEHDLKRSITLFEKIQEEKITDYSFDKKYLHKNGNVIDCHVTVKWTFDTADKVDYSIAFIADKTEERKAQKRVLDLRSALDSTSAVFFTNAKGQIKDINKRLEILSGYSRKEIIGKTPKIFNSDYHSRKEWKLFWATIKAGKTFKGEIRNRKKDGSIYWIYVTVSPIVNDKGIIDQYISIQIDITEEKRVKNNLIKEVIEAQEHERERFAMEIHDGLGQVLLATKMNLSAVSDSSDGLDIESKKVLNNSIDLLTQAVQEARSISHGLMSRLLSQFGLAYAVNEIVGSINTSSCLNFTFNHNIKDVRFEEEIEMGIYRTLQELIKNIIKHSKATKANLSVIKKGKELSIEIEDNGVGIAEGTLRNPKSGGIGLRNMRSRIEYLGGAFEIDNKIKKGTKIKINISL